MNLKNAPWRAYRKYRLDGAEACLRSAREALFVNVLGYRGVYQRLLRGRLPRLSREALKSAGSCSTYEACTGEVPTKQAGGLPRRDSAVKTYWPGDRFVCAIEDATVLGPVGPGITNDGQLVEETVAIPRKADRRIGVAIAKALVETGPRQMARVLAGTGESEQRVVTAAIMHPPWNNYYHWTIETLPRIRALERYAEESGEYPDLLVPADRPSWMDETIDRINYRGRVLGWSGPVADVDRLVVPVFPDPTPEECRWLRDRMRSGRDRERSPGGSRVFISREDATIRKVMNAGEILPVLDEYGFETHVLTELSVAEQVGLFANAEIVVAAHGAGLTNLVYADDLTVIELFGDKKIASFARLAEMLDHEYVPVDCDQRGVDLVVDPSALERAIESVS
jgi:capsular polysaccharide biosynthesis protein